MRVKLHPVSLWNWHPADTRFATHLTPCSECCKVNDSAMNPFTVSTVGPCGKWASTLWQLKRLPAASRQNQIRPIHIGKNGRFTTKRTIFVGWLSWLVAVWPAELQFQESFSICIYIDYHYCLYYLSSCLSTELQLQLQSAGKLSREKNNNII